MADKTTKKTDESAPTGEEQQDNVQLPSPTLSGGPSQDDLNPAFAPPKADDKG